MATGHHPAGQEVDTVPQVIRKDQQSKLHREVSTPVVILAAVVVLVVLVFLFDRFITPIVPRRQMSEQEAWEKRLKEMQQAMPQGGWASPAPGMPPVYVPPAGQPLNTPPPR